MWIHYWNGIKQSVNIIFDDSKTMGSTGLESIIVTILYYKVFITDIYY